MQTLANIEVQITELRQDRLAFTSSASQRLRDDVRLDEIGIGRVGRKSRVGAISMIEKVIDDKK